MPERARRALVVSVATVALSLALAGAASAHDCSSPRDCEQTAGYNAMIAITGGVVAVGAGLIGVYVGTSAGALPVVPPAPRPPATPIAPPPGGPLVDGSGNTIPRWEPGKYGADSAGRTGRPGDLWYGGRWQPEARVRDAIERARAEEAQTARLHEEFQRVRATDRGEDPEIKAMRDRHRATQETLKQERAALDEERRRLLSDIRDLNAKQAERWNAQVRKWDRYSQVASTIQKGADTSVSILGQYTGTPGKIVSGAYTFTKTVAGELAKGESFGAAVKAGSSELVLDLTAGKVQSKLGLEFKTPNLPNAPVGELLKEAAQTGARTVVVGAGKGIANFGLGEVIKYPFTKFADFFLGGK